MSNVPPAPPSRPRSGRQPPSNSGTILALFGLLLVGGALLGLVALVMPHALAIVLVIGGLFASLVLHYLIWGWWLSQMKDESATEEPTIKPQPPSSTAV